MDDETGHIIAVKKVIIYGKERNVMVAYKHEDAGVKILTIHPLKEGQKKTGFNLEDGGKYNGRF